MLTRLLLSALLPAFLIASLALSGSAGKARAAGDGLNDAQKKDVEKVIRDYIVGNPEILIRAMQEYRIAQQNAAREKTKNNLLSLAADLNVNPASPVSGNPQGDITVVEFFDYRCPYCKKVFPTIQTLLKEDGNIRYVLKEFPILGPVSVIASQAALAIWNIEPDKYMAFHTALMTARGQLSEKRIFSIAEKLGIDGAAVRKKMGEPVVMDELNKNMELSQSLGINGTPAFVIGENVVPGAIDMKELKTLISAARKG